MKSKKIVVIENDAIGTYTIRRKLMEELTSNGYELVIITGESEFFHKVKTELKFNIIDIGVSSLNPVDVVKYNYRLFIHLKRTDPICVLTFTIRPAIYGNICTRLLGIPTISNITGIGPLLDSKKMVYRIIRLLYKVVLKKTKKIFFQNYDDLNVFIENGYANLSQVERIPGSGIEFEKFMPVEKEDKLRFVFLYIGRLVKDKGIIEFIEAAKVVKEQAQNTEFWVVGPFWKQNLKENTISKAFIEEQVQKEIITYLGEVDDVKPIISKSDCVVLPSYREGTSNVLLEAASMEKPLIASNVTGCKEIIENQVTGFLCRVKDSQDLSDKMLSMYQMKDYDRQQMGKKGREKVVKEFDKRIVIEAYLNAIKNIMKDE